MRQKPIKHNCQENALLENSEALLLLNLFLL